jgi:hypothetical protein
MLEYLRKSPVLRLGGNQTVTLKSTRPPARSLVLSAEGVIANGGDKPVAFMFGPENGAVTEMQVFEAAREARLKGYERLFVVGFAIEAKARTLVEKCAEAAGIPAAWDSLKRALRGAYEDTVWDHLAGTLSEPFPAGQHGQVAVKVIDDRGNELLVVKKLSEARKSGGKR